MNTVAPAKPEYKMSLNSIAKTPYNVSLVLFT